MHKPHAKLRLECGNRRVAAIDVIFRRLAAPARLPAAQVWIKILRASVSMAAVTITHFVIRASQACRLIPLFVAA